MLLIFFKRVLAAIPVLIIVASLTFFFVRLAPGGPFDTDRAVSNEVLINLQESYNLNAPISEQYFDYMGGVLVGYELARQLKTKSVFYERVNGTFKLRRGFEIESNAKVVLVEDVITTGKSANECIIELNKIGVNLLATVCLIDRTNNESVIKNPISIHKLDIPIYDEDSLPDELKSIRPIKPGSRDI